MSISRCAKSRDYDLLAKYIQLLLRKEIHELRDLTMPFDHPTQICQGKFTIKDEELRISTIFLCRLKGKKTVNNSKESSTRLRATACPKMKAEAHEQRNVVFRNSLLQFTIVKATKGVTRYTFKMQKTNPGPTRFH